MWDVNHVHYAVEIAAGVGTKRPTVSSLLVLNM